MSEGNTALSVANQTIVKKDVKFLCIYIQQERILSLEKIMKDLNANLAAMRVDRQKTIEAHQSRIQQLQEKFSIDISKARQDGVYLYF